MYFRGTFSSASVTPQTGLDVRLESPRAAPDAPDDAVDAPRRFHVATVRRSDSFASPQTAAATVCSFWLELPSEKLRVRAITLATDSSFRGVLPKQAWSRFVGKGDLDPSVCHDLAAHLVLDATGALALDADLRHVATVRTVRTGDGTSGGGLRQGGDQRWVCSFWLELPSEQLRVRAIDLDTDASFRGVLPKEVWVRNLDGDGDDAASAASATSLASDLLGPRLCKALAARLRLDASGTLALVDAAPAPSPASASSSRALSASSTRAFERHLSSAGVSFAGGRYLVCSFWQGPRGLRVRGIDPLTDATFDSQPIDSAQWAPLGLGPLEAIPLDKAHDICRVLAPCLVLRPGNQIALDSAVRTSTPRAHLGRPSSARRPNSARRRDGPKWIN